MVVINSIPLYHWILVRKLSRNIINYQSFLNLPLSPLILYFCLHGFQNDVNNLISKVKIIDCNSITCTNTILIMNKLILIYLI